MVVPINLLKPILNDLVTLGRRSAPPKPWLGLYASELEDRVVIVGRSQRGPGRVAGFILSVLAKRLGSGVWGQS